MKYNPEIHHRRSIRLKGYTYSQAGAYFVSICTQNRECLFGVVGAKNFSPLQPGQRPRGTSKTIGSVIRGFKIGVTKWMRTQTNVYDVWQRNYYEHIIRNENELDRIREYIVNNPLKWEFDRENPDVSILETPAVQRKGQS